MNKLVVVQLFTWLDSNNLIPSSQSSFRHSTKTLPPTYSPTFIVPLTSRNSRCLHNLMLLLLSTLWTMTPLRMRLSVSFGINGLLLAWLSSYMSLTDCIASQFFCSTSSSWHPTPFGLPHRSDVGPLYILSTAEIAPLLASSSFLSHSYADDVQAYSHGWLS